MARHNRDGRGSDQRGHDYAINYQPDWIRWIKVTRALESGRQSTKTLFRNPEERQREPGERTRTRIESPEQDLNFGIIVEDPEGVVRQVTVETVRPGMPESEGTVTFTIRDQG